MRLKKLELQGFKSFPDKTTVNFDKGLTVIVGPNGSGKSNISDAMRWVLGEMSTKNIRGTKMEDVIFAGSQKRSPMSFAEVSVTFDNSEEEGRLVTAEDYDEITVTRRYYRAGESEYFINRKPVRLRDIHELFLNTGLGKGGYSIIGQGKIAEIISRKNDERRAVFEEAAGIAKYKFQKLEAMRNLDGTNENLTRLEDITGELSARIGPLERESAKAKKYLEIYERKKGIDIALSLYDIDAAKRRSADVSEKLAIAKRNLEAAEEKLSDAEARESALAEKQSGNRIEAERFTQEIAAQKEKLHEKESAALVCESENVHFAETEKTARAKLAESEAERANTEKELTAKREALEEARRKKAEKKEEADKAEAEIAEYREALARADDDVNDAAKKKAELDKRTVEAKLRASELEARAESDEKKYEALRESAEKHEADIALYSGRMEKAESKIAAYSEKEAQERAELEKAEKKKAEAESRRAELEKKKNEYFLEASQRKHKVQNLVRMEELLEGFSRAVRFIVNEYSQGKITGKDGGKITLYGPLSQLISTDEKYSVALETAFGQSLQNIVAKDEYSAKAAIEYLKKRNAGRATFYPIDTMKGTEADAATLGLSAGEGFIAVASTLVKCEDNLRGIVKSIVGRIIIADNMDNAAKMARKLAYRYRIVTLDGQVINAGGSFTGGSSATESQLLSRRSQIDRLNEEIASIEKAAKGVDSELAELAKATADIKAEYDAAAGRLATVRKMSEAEEVQLEVLRSGKEMLASSLDVIKAEMKALDESMSGYRRDIGGIAERKDEFDTEAALLAFKENEINSQRASLEEKLEELEDKRSDLLIELAREETNTELLASLLEAVEAKAEIYRSTAASLEETIAEAIRKTAENKEKIEKLRSEAAVLSRKLGEYEHTRAELVSEGADIEQSLNTVRTSQKNAMNEKELVFRDYTKLENDLENANTRADGLITFLWDDYELTYDEARKQCAEPITPATRAETAAEQAKLKNTLRSLGNVNLNAIEEYKEVSERYGKMHEQMQDLTASREALMRNIAELERCMCTDFVSTMEQININFGKTFTELFGGGRAEVKLSDPENVLESGIDINVAPPGKVIKSLSLLSGGEQAFVAIALYFAILEVNPAPFCIMDEIEAALDEVNVDKFADYVKRYSEKTQFVLITHRRGTMEAAERLYGVTMHEKGISDIISVDVSEIEHRAGKLLE